MALDRHLLPQGTDPLLLPPGCTPPSTHPLPPSSSSSSLDSFDSFSSTFTAPETPEVASDSSPATVKDYPQQQQQQQEQEQQPIPPSPILSPGPASSLPSPLPSPRRLSARPTPLIITTAVNSKPPQFLPRTSSLRSLPGNPITLATATAGRRSHSLASDRDPQLPPIRLLSGPFSGPGPIRRKPVASTASLLADQRPVSSQSYLPISVEEDEQEESHEEFHEEQEFHDTDNQDSNDGADYLDHLDGYADSLDRDDLDPFELDHLDHDSLDLDQLPRPDQRFTRSCSVDSPTLYEFPGEPLTKTHEELPLSSLLAPASLSVSKQSDTTTKGSAVAAADGPDDPDGPDGAVVTFHTSQALVAPAAPQANATDVSEQYEQDSVTDLDDEEQLDEWQEEPKQADEPSEPDQDQDESPDAAAQTPASTMSLFSRKTSPPHLSLGAASNLSDHKDEKSPSSSSLYSAYQDEPSPIPLTTTTSTNTLTPANVAQAVLAQSLQPSPAQSGKPDTLKPLPKSPASSKLGNFFGWSPSPSSTEFSDRGFSPLPSPFSLQPQSVGTHASTLSTAGTADNDYKNPSEARTRPGSLDLQASTQTAQIPQLLPPLSPSGELEEMEDELKAISAELASSIRREIDLEDLVDRLQAEVGSTQTPSKRTSDYYSDSGYSSSKGLSDYDAAREEIAQVQRRAEQEKAQVRLELTQKLSDERTRRSFLDQQIKELGERAANLDLVQTQRNTEDVSGRVKQLEGACEDLRRRLAEERGVKENFEDLLAAMKGELQSATNERDNLRDEVVPQLRARIEGLESQANELERQTYATSKIQQELQTLKEENSSLRSMSLSMAAAAATTVPTATDDGERERERELQQQDSGFKLQRPPAPLSRSNTLTRSNTLSRSNTVKRQQQQQQQQQQLLQGPGAPAATSTINESRETLAERLRDVEAQRDALHSALKSLLDRQEFQMRENGKKVRVLELERERLLTASPKKAGYEHDVATLREEVSTLRRRAEDALEQKWQVEKGLSGLKMDLDRAEEEIAGLRKLLQQSDILALPASRVVSGASGVSSESAGTPATSASLEAAFRSLQARYGEALEHIRTLEVPSADGTPAAVVSDEKTALAIRRLEQALAGAKADRNAARQDAAVKESQLADAAAAEASLMESERHLAAQLDAAAARVEELTQQVQTQLAANSNLRARLAAMLARGETEQRFNKERITGLEARLRTLEEQLVAAQTAAEDGVSRHEEQVAALREAHNTQLQRLRDASGQLRAPPPSPRGGYTGIGGVRSPGLSPRPFTAGSGGTRSPMSPMFAINGRLVPSRPSSRGSSLGSGGGGGTGATPTVEADQQVLMTTLRARVSELEGALASADSELQEVVGRMNMAQIEVLQLQEEREQAARETRQLQRQLEAEQLKNFEERFRSLGRSATLA